MLFEENNENNWWGGEDKSTDNHDTPNDWAGGKKEDTTSIPKARFDEVNEKRKAAEAELAKYKEAEAKKAEEEALKKWEYDKIISQKDQELADLKKQQESWKAREEAQVKRNEERIEALSKKFWDDRGNVKNLIEWFTDPFVLSDKISTLENMSVKSSQWGQVWGSNVPNGWNMTRKQELMDKLKNGQQLSAKEQNELLTLSSWNS